MDKLEPSHTHSYAEAWSKDETSHWHECECGERAEEASHAPVIDPAEAATCTASGKTEGSHCSVCGYVITAQEEVPATGHNYSETWSHNAAEHWRSCSACDTKTALGPHTWNGGVETKAPTATTPGVRTFTCTVCAAVKTEPIPATGGNPDPGPGPGPGPGPAPGPGPSIVTPAEPVKYAVTLPDERTGGTVSADKETAEAGSQVTLTVKPQEGFQIAALSVKDSSGAEVELAAIGNGAYTFAMPSSAVKVTAAFEKMPEEKRPLPFTDVKEASWYYAAVDRMYQKGAMEGTTPTTFSPFAPASRAMLVTVLYRLEGEPTVTDPVSFPDVKAKWCAPAIAWAAEHGIVLGYADGTFGPNDEITREQVAAILFRYAQYKGWNISARADLSGYGDSGKIHKYAREAMSWANAVGIMSGRNAATLAPDGVASRAEVAVMLNRLSEPKG